MTKTMTTAGGNVDARKQATRNWCRRFRQASAYLVHTLLVTLLVTHSRWQTARADDAGSQSPLDMGVLASLASNIGSNPQIMNLVTNFLNPSGSGGISRRPDAAGLEQDPANLPQTSTMNEPLRRGMRLNQPEAQQQTTGQQQQPQQPQQQQQQQQSRETQQTASPSPTGSSANPLGNLITMLPGMLGGTGGGTGGPLAGLLGGLAKSSTPSSTTNNLDQSASTQIAPASGPPQAQQSAPASTNFSPAQSVINQVLAAYVSRQIPDELIQLAVSGRVPPQLIELALSGQVPPQLIQMIITGQVPMPVINTFLSSAATSGAGAMPQQQVGSRAPAGGSNAAQSQQATPTPGIFSTTRAFFDSVFKRDANGRPIITVPTLLGSIPIRVPSLPGARSIGQMVGGTISNVASIL